MVVCDACQLCSMVDFSLAQEAAQSPVLWVEMNTGSVKECWKEGEKAKSTERNRNLVSLSQHPGWE